MQSTPQPKLGTVNALSFHDTVLSAALPVLVEVSSTWCAPCRAAEPVLQAMATSRQGELAVVKIDAEESPDLVAQLGVRGFPTFLMFRQGTELGRHAGFRSAKHLHAWADETLGG